MHASFRPLPPTPYTDRTPDDVTRDPRPGDTLRAAGAFDPTPRDYHVLAEGWCTLDPRAPRAVPLWALRDPVGVPRCLATDPRPGDTYHRNGHVEEVVEVTAGKVRSIDATGDTYTTPLDAWAVSARAWTACYDRRGGARFDPQVGDRAYAGSDVGWEVTARVGDLLALTPVRAGPDVTCPVEVWADAGGVAVLFPARYVRVVRS